jgi:hypothetical protein
MRVDRNERIWAEAKRAAARMRQVIAATPQNAAGRVSSGIAGELEKLGYEFDHEYGDAEERMEVWVNREAGMGIMLEWFRLVEVEP